MSLKKLIAENGGAICRLLREKGFSCSVEPSERLLALAIQNTPGLASEISEAIKEEVALEPIVIDTKPTTTEPVYFFGSKKEDERQMMDKALGGLVIFLIVLAVGFALVKSK